MKVSVITVCKNAEKTIEKTIQSVLNQTYPNIEYIIVDGASQDKTLKIIHSYNKIDKVISELDNSAEEAIEKGVKASTGELICLLCADDWYESDAVELLVNSFYKNPEVDFVYGKTRFIHNNGQKTISSVNENSYKNLWLNCSIHIEALAVRRNIYENNLFDLSYKIAPDREWMLRCLVNGAKFLYIPHIIVNFTMNGKSENNFEEAYKEDMKIIKKYYSLCPIKERALKEYQWLQKISIFRRKNGFDFVKCLKKTFADFNGSVVIWGVGTWGERILDKCIDARIVVDAILDSNPEKIGTFVYHHRIESPEILSGKNDVFVILAMKNVNEELMVRINKLGIKSENYASLEDIMDNATVDIYWEPLE